MGPKPAQAQPQWAPVTVNVSSPKGKPPVGWVQQGDYVPRTTSYKINITPVVDWATPDGNPMPDKDQTVPFLAQVYTGPVGGGSTVNLTYTLSNVLRGKRLFKSFNGPPPHPNLVPAGDFTFFPYFNSKFNVQCTGTQCTPDTIEAPIHATYGDVLIKMQLSDGTPITNATVTAMAPMVDPPFGNPPQFGIAPGYRLNYARQEFTGTGENRKGTGKYSFAFTGITRAEPPNSPYCNSQVSQYVCDWLQVDRGNHWGLRVMGDGSGDSSFAARFNYSNTPGRLTYALSASAILWRKLEHENGTENVSVYFEQDQEIVSGEQPLITLVAPPGLETPQCEDENDCSIPYPVDPSSGTVTLNQTDVVIPGLGDGLVFTRSYNHQKTRPGVFGKGWRHNYERSIVIDAFANVDDPAERSLLLRFIDRNGAVLYYSDHDQDGVYTRYGNPDSRDKITRSADITTYRRTLADQSYEDFNTQGELIRIVDTLGRTTTLTYQLDSRYSDPANHPGRLIEVAAPDGRKLTFSYIAGSGFPGMLSRISGPAGLVAEYGHTWVYDSSGAPPRAQLISVTYADGRGHRFGYDDKHRVTTVSDLTGVVTDRHEYNADNKASATERNGGVNRYSIAYDGNITTVTDALGNVATMEYGDTIAGRRLKKRTNCGFCGQASGTEEWEHDEQGRMTKHIDVEGNETVYHYEDGELSEVVNPLGRTTTYSNYDAQRRPGTISPQGLASTNVTYVPEGVSSIARGVGGIDVAYANQRLSSITTAGGLTYGFTVNDFGETIATTDPRGKVRQMAYDKLGFLTSIEEPDGKVTRFIRDGRGRVTSATRPDGKVRRYTYNAAGRIDTVTDEKNRTSRHVYDAHGRPIRVFDPAGQRSEFEYDLMSNLTLLRDAKGQETRFRYDNLRRVIEMKDPAGGVETYEYWPSGRLKSKRDRKNVLTSYTYDAIGRLVTRTHSDATFALNVTYDDDARTVAAANGYDTLIWSFDLRGRLTSEQSLKNSSTVSYQYNADDHRILMGINIAGQPVETQYSYVGGLLDAIVRTASTGPSRTWTFGYNDLGMRTSMSLPNGLATAYSYDPNVRWLDEVKTMNGADVVMTAAYTHDDIGNRLTKAILEGTETYGYDVLDRLTKATRPAAEQQWTYDAAGNRTVSEAGGVARDAEFDSRNRLNESGATGSLLVTGTTDEASSVSVNGQPAAMLSGNRFERRVPYSTAGAQSVNVAATDASGNVRTSEYEIDVTSDSASYEYDANGSLVEKTAGGHVWTYTWNALGELREVWKDGVQRAVYVYDPVGRRIEKTVIDPNPSLTVTTEWVYDGMDILREQLTTSALVSHSYYLHGPGIDEPLGKETAGAWEYYHADGLGSVVKVTNQAGAVTHTYGYDAWGNIEAGAERPGFAFTGREWDPEIGMYYYRARYYDPKAGRFISEDPIAFSGGLNFYQYVLGMPTAWRDPLGLEANINLFTPNTDAWHAGNLLDRKGVYTVVGHGVPEIKNGPAWAIGDGDPASGPRITPEQLVEMILADEAWQGQPILLLACQTSNTDSSYPESYAERFAEHLAAAAHRNVDVTGWFATDVNFRKVNTTTVAGTTGEQRFTRQHPH